MSRNVLVFVLALACAGRLAAQSASLQVLHSFSGPPNGLPPAAQLTQGSDGNFYGVTQSGGNANAGTVFQLTPAGALTTIYSFTGGAGGANPYAGLTLGSDGNFYGTTHGGGDSDGDGTVFKITPAGALTTLYTFSGTDGKFPAAILTQGADGNFYGTTEGDQGVTSYGTVFQLTPAGVLTTFHSFTGGADSGTPSGALCLGVDGDFYGTTTGFSTSTPAGTVYKVTTSGAFTAVHTFTGGAGGDSPAGGLTLAHDGNLYGATREGGDSNGDGTIYKIAADGTFTSVCNFPGGAGASYPTDGLTLGFDDNLYGTTYSGGDSNGDGTIYQVTTAGVLTTIYALSRADGAHPSVALTQGTNTNFYSTTGGGGVNNADGTIFEVSSAGQYTTLYTFTGASAGSAPVAGLTQGTDGNFYGTTSQGGIGSGHGTVFQLTPAGVFTSLYAFSGGADGEFPRADLIQGSNGNFYGTAENGGNINLDGTVFEITPAGALTTLHVFAGNAEGARPLAGLTLGNDGNFYGTTSAGGNSNGDGAFFEITPAGSLTTLGVFSNGANGSVPLGDLTLGSDGNFYGTASKGGYYFDGTVVQITPAGVFTPIYVFSGADGATPAAGLIPGGDGYFYGTTEKGGSGSGTVFKITSAGALTTLYTFTGGADGAFPLGSLTLGSDGSFYGTTSGGGDSNGDGTVFEITPAGVFTTLYTFSGADGANPQARLTLGSDGNFYGTTENGGLNGVGSVFFLTLSPPVVSDSTETAQVTAAFRFQITATNRPTSYAANNLPAGLSVNATTGVISGTPTQSGAFTVAISATNGAGTGSGTLTLTVSPAPVLTPVVTSAGASAKVGTPFSFQITAINNPTSYAASNLPLGVTADAATGLISGTPTQNGTFIVTLSATNSAGTGDGTLTLTVSPTAPVISSALSASGQQGQFFTYQITASNTPTSFGASGLPLGLSVDMGAGLISGTPTVSGTFSVNLSVANAGGTGAAVLTITLAPSPQPAVTLVPTVSQVVAGSGSAGEFTLSLSSPPSADLVVSYAIKGTAINGVDYQLIKASKKIKAGKTSKIIKIVPQGDLGGASKKVVALVLQPGTGYTIGTASKVKVKILAAP